MVICTMMINVNYLIFYHYVEENLKDFMVIIYL